MKVLRAWSIKVVCESCLFRLKIDAGDIRVRLVNNSGRTGSLTANKIPEYFIECEECGDEVMIQEGFDGELPEKVKAVAEKNSGVNLNKIRYEI